MAEPSRQELVNWVNATLQLDVAKVDDCGKGFVYCQLLDSIFLDIPINRVNFNARNEYEYLNNFKILQAAFTSHGIDRPIPVERLVKCRLQDNLEFLQWFKHYWDGNFSGHGYDALARRSQSKSSRPSAIGTSRSSLAQATPAPSRPSPAPRPSSSTARPGITGPARSRAVPPTSGQAPVRASSRTSQPPAPLKPRAPPVGRAPLSGAPPRVSSATGSARAPAAAARNTPGRAGSGLNSRTSTTPVAAPGPRTAALAAENEQLKQEVEVQKAQYVNLENELDEISTQLDSVACESEFYFKKLRDIEIIVQTISDLIEQKEELEAQTAKISGGHDDKNGSGALSSDSEKTLNTPVIDKETEEMLRPLNIIRTIAEILYSTEDGFESPANHAAADGQMADMDGSAMDIDTIPEGDDETF